MQNVVCVVVVVNFIDAVAGARVGEETNSVAAAQAGDAVRLDIPAGGVV